MLATSATKISEVFHPVPETQKAQLHDPAAKGQSLPTTAKNPFGLAIVRSTDPDLSTKWQHAEAGMRADAEVLARCRSDPPACPSSGARRFIALVDAARAHHGRARLGEVNRAINLAVRPINDQDQHGVADFWATPLSSLTSGRGDCEDYAIAKYAALREAGLAPEDVKLVIVRDSAMRVDHAVVVARLEDRWLVLDNRRLVMLEDVDLKNSTPLFALDHEGVKRFAPIAPAQTLAAIAPTKSAASNLKSARQ